MSNGLDCRIESSQCIIRQITTFLQNILTSFFFKSLFHASNLNSWWKLNTWNNGRTKEETKIFRRNSMISRIVFWLDSICGNHECRLYLNLSKFLLIIVLRIISKYGFCWRVYTQLLMYLVHCTLKKITTLQQKFRDLVL